MLPVWLRPAPILRGLLVAHLLGTAVVYAAAALIPPPQPPGWSTVAALSLSGATFGLVACHGLLLASWWTLGPGSGWRRLGQTLQLLLPLLLVHSIGRVAIEPVELRESDLFIEWVAKLQQAAVVLGATLIVFGQVGWLAGRFGWRWRNDPPDLTRPTQFSITQTLLLTLGCAGFFGVVRWLQENSETWNSWLAVLRAGETSFVLHYFIFFGAFIAAVLLPAAACSGRRLRASAIFLAIVAAYGLGWAEATLLFGDIPELQPMIVGGAMSAAVLTIGSLLTLRAGGWRIDRDAPRDTVKAA